MSSEPEGLHHIQPKASPWGIATQRNDKKRQQPLYFPTIEHHNDTFLKMKKNPTSIIIVVGRMKNKTIYILELN